MKLSFKNRHQRLKYTAPPHRNTTNGPIHSHGTPQLLCLRNELPTRFISSDWGLLWKALIKSLRIHSIIFLKNSRFLITLPTHNKHIFVRSKKGAFYGKSAYLGKSAYFEKWRISHALHNFSKIIKNESYSMLMKYRLFFPKSSSSPNKHIFVRTKRVCLLWENCLLWVGTVSGLAPSY